MKYIIIALSFLTLGCDIESCPDRCSPCGYYHNRWPDYECCVRAKSAVWDSQAQAYESCIRNKLLREAIDKGFPEAGRF